MQFDFTQTMKEATDAELLKIIITNRNEYQEVAIQAAEVEFLKRNLSTEQITAAKAFNEQQHHIQGLKATKPLNTYLKVLTFLFPGVFMLIVSGIFKGDGYSRKANEMIKWTLYGFGFYIALVLITSLL